MRFNKRAPSDIPTIDLVPMLTVMMGVLAFFVVVTVSLGSEELIEVELPPQQEDDSPPPVESLSDLFIVELDAQAQTRLNGEPITAEQLALRVETYLAQNPQNTVYLVPDQTLPYEEVMQFLGQMRQVGGDRVSLALEE
ncbi:MAG: biopolymer transporter ExbD [Leptolyngbya sp. SIO4C1]|nr:biopolymer transporter ExbD [Leptolyngbya sp. SIO4C1]